MRNVTRWKRSVLWISYMTPTIPLAITTLSVTREPCHFQQLLFSIAACSAQ
jgi:hypothetical protein